MKSSRTKSPNRVVSKLFVAFLFFASLGCGSEVFGGSGNGNSNNETPIDNKGGNNEVARLRIQGTQLIHPNGRPIMLRGFNWGNWELAQPQDASDHVKQGANVIRLVLRWWGLYALSSIDSRLDSAPGHVSPTHLERLDQEIQWATSKGIWVVLALDSNCGQNGLQDRATQEFCDPRNQYGDRGNNFWTNPEMRQKFIELWKYVANRYKDNPYIAMYEILPEPAPAKGTSEQTRSFYKQLIDSIRTVDDRTPFLIGTSPNYNIRSAPNAYLSEEKYNGKIIYTGNLFVYTQRESDEVIQNLELRLQGLLRLRDKFNVPVFVQQTGVRTAEDRDYKYLNAVLSLLNQHSVPWTMWEYRDRAGTPNSYGVYYYDRTKKQWILKPRTLEVVTSHFR